MYNVLLFFVGIIAIILLSYINSFMSGNKEEAPLTVYIYEN